MKTRNQIEEKYKWDLSNYFASMQEWDNEFESIKPLYQQLATYEGKLGYDETLLECLKLENQVSERMGRLAVFIALKCKEDGNISIVYLLDFGTNNPSISTKRSSDSIIIFRVLSKKTFE